MAQGTCDGAPCQECTKACSERVGDIEEYRAELAIIDARSRQMQEKITLLSHTPRNTRRSADWLNRKDDIGMTALYTELPLNMGMTREELMSGKPIIGIAQSGSDIAPCNRYHLELAKRVRDGIRSAGGI